MPGPDRIVVVGGGIIGVSSAYFLSHHPSNPSVTLIEASSIASGASGKAGGLLALDWHGSETTSLAAFSYQLHSSLAKLHNGRERWGYRELDTLELSCNEDGKRDKNPSKTPNWVRPGVVLKANSLGSPQTTAQIHPKKFCEAIASESKNLKIINGFATRILLDKDSFVSGVEIVQDGNIENIEADFVVIATGPWTTRILPNIPVTSQRAHSVVISTPEPVSPHALFTNIRMKDGSVVTPEIYPRADEVYACGDLDNLVKLPKLAKDVPVDKQRCEEILKNINTILDLPNANPDITMQACYLPYSELGPGPSIGWVPGMKKVAVAAGHSCWGICNGPGTGKLISELVCDGQIKSADVSLLDPVKYMKK